MNAVKQVIAVRCKNCVKPIYTLYGQNSKLLFKLVILGFKWLVRYNKIHVYILIFKVIISTWHCIDLCALCIVLQSSVSQFVPAIVEACVKVVELKGLDVQGIHHKRGSQKASSALKMRVKRRLDIYSIQVWFYCEIFLALIISSV
jgi:hypothetical protein